MAARILLVIAVVMMLVSLCGCQTVDGVGHAVQGMGRDICWLGQQRVSVTFHHAEQEPLYYSEIGGQTAYFRKVDGQYVQVAMQ
ncbi:MAG TPA: hypothetical protein ENN87_00925 [Phycisphaerales bacterium]|jgi:predicted small secreted protein|nr:hypothetical protein [Phycisphaerales bacterium]